VGSPDLILNFGTTLLAPEWLLLASVSQFYLLLSHLTPLIKGIPSNYRVHIWFGKTRMAGLQSGEGRTMIDSVVWAQYINVTDRHTDSHVAIHRKCVRWQNMAINSRQVTTQCAPGPNFVPACKSPHDMLIQSHDMQISLRYANSEP